MTAHSTLHDDRKCGHYHNGAGGGGIHWHVNNAYWWEIQQSRSGSSVEHAQELHADGQYATDYGVA